MWSHGSGAPRLVKKSDPTTSRWHARLGWYPWGVPRAHPSMFSNLAHNNPLPLSVCLKWWYCLMKSRLVWRLNERLRLHKYCNFVACTADTDTFHHSPASTQCYASPCAEVKVWWYCLMSLRYVWRLRRCKTSWCALTFFMPKWRLNLHDKLHLHQDSNL